MAEELDFSNQKNFPGTHGNSFDVIIHVWDIINAIPAPLFALLLMLLAAAASLFRQPYALALLGFFSLDWLLLALLPVLKLSFGPSKTTTLALAGMRSLFALLPIPWQAGLALQAAGTLLVIYAFYIEPHRLIVTRQRLHSAALNGGRPLRILHLGDLHVERITARERRLNRLVKELNPDLILFTGDLLNLSYLNDPTAHEHLRSILADWSAPLGVYVVSGSPAVDLPEIMPDLLKGLPLRWLQNEKVSVRHGENQIDLFGLHCTHKPFIDGPRLEELVHPVLSNFSILLYHSPDLAPVAARCGFNLQLSGHTHGGQVRLPLYGALFTASLYGKRYESGRRQVDDMTLYVTRGIGMEGAGAPRVRFLCPPEIILWEISGKP